MQFTQFLYDAQTLAISHIVTGTNYEAVLAKALIVALDVKGPVALSSCSNGLKLGDNVTVVDFDVLKESRMTQIEPTQLILQKLLRDRGFEGAIQALIDAVRAESNTELAREHIEIADLLEEKAQLLETLDV